MNQTTNACQQCGHTCPVDRVCARCGGDPMEPGDRLCVVCDAAERDTPEADPRQPGDDDGREYGHPGDALADRGEYRGPGR